jgi:aconitate hydratase
VEGPVLLKLGDDISTDEIMPAGEQVLPYRSNIPEISKFVFARVDETFYDRAMQHLLSGCLVIGGRNYGQGSSREHAAIAPKYLGLKAVIAKSFARIHRQNLINFGILPLTFANPNDWERIDRDDVLVLPDIRAASNKETRYRSSTRRKEKHTPWSMQ